MAITLRSILIIASLFAPSLTVPTLDLDLVQPAHSPEHSPSHPTFSPFRRIRDSIIERIWPKYSQNRSKYIRPGQSVPATFRRKYDDDVVLRFPIGNREEAQIFAAAADMLFLDVWDSSTNWTDVRVARNVLPSFLDLLPASMQNSHKPLMHDLAMAVHDTYPISYGMNSRSWRSKSVLERGMNDMFFEDYQPLSVIYAWLRLLNTYYPNLSDLTTIGVSAEGREIQALRIGSRARLSPGEKIHTVLIAAGSHAREWISVSTATYIAFDLLTRYGSPSETLLTKFLDHYDIVFVPVMNPDGYEYTWTTDRLWRKTRQVTNLPFCAGIDLDRAFPFHWDGHGEIDNPCTESYAGKEPLEAVEAKVLTDWAKNVTEHANVQFSAYLDLHSYSQKILYPYSWSCHYDPPNLEDLEEVALGLAKNFRITTGHFYGIQSACEGYVTATKDEMSPKSRKSKISSGGISGGSSLDYFYAEHNIKYAYQIKLRDTGTYGFLLPKENIVPTGRESVEAVIGLGRWLLGDRGIETEPAIEDSNEGPSALKDDSVVQKKETSSNNVHNPDFNETDDNDDDEWERVYDPEFELRRRR